jgi:hypothetical protein
MSIAGERSRPRKGAMTTVLKTGEPGKEKVLLWSPKLVLRLVTSGVKCLKFIYNKSFFLESAIILSLFCYTFLKLITTNVII